MSSRKFSETNFASEQTPTKRPDLSHRNNVFPPKGTTHFYFTHDDDDTNYYFCFNKNSTKLNLHLMLFNQRESLWFPIMNYWIDLKKGKLPHQFLLDIFKSNLSQSEVNSKEIQDIINMKAEDIGEWYMFEYDYNKIRGQTFNNIKMYQFDCQEMYLFFYFFLIFF